MESSAAGFFLMLGDEARRGDEHAARTARGVEDAPVIRLDDFGEEPDDAAGGVKFAAALALAHGELAEEVFVDAPEGVVVQRGGISETFLSSSLRRVLVKRL
jgi:hypothetical protein